MPNDVFNQEFNEIIPDGAPGNQAYFGIFYQDRRGRFIRLTQAEGNEIANNPEMKERNTIGMTAPKTEVRSYSEQFSKNILIEKADSNYDFFKDFDDNKWSGKNAQLRMVMVDFMRSEPVGGGKQRYKAYSYNTTVTVTTANNTDGILSVDFNQSSERVNGTAELATDKESAVFTPSSEIAVSGIALSDSSVTIAENEEKWIAVDFVPFGSPETFQFTVTNKIICEAEIRRRSLVITGKSTGSTTITVKSASNEAITSAIQVTVEETEEEDDPVEDD